MLAQLNPPLSSWVTIAFAVTWVVLLALWVKSAKDLKAYREAMKGTSGERLEPLLQEHLRTKSRLENDYDGARQRLDRIETWMREANTRTGFVRYDAFDDAGGKQSFALALQNDHGDGVVVTSIATRDGHRIFAKGIQGGKAEVQLTPEESHAIELATRGHA